MIMSYNAVIILLLLYVTYVFATPVNYTDFVYFAPFFNKSIKEFEAIE